MIEPLEERRLFAAVDPATVRLIGITGNQQNPDFNDETLFDIRYAGDAGDQSVFTDGFEPIAGQPPTTVSLSNSVGVTVGLGALRVDVPQGQNSFWGVRSGNLVDALKAGASTLTYDETLIGRELNGGSFSGDDSSFNGFAQSNELAVVIAAPSGGFIQRNFTDGGGSDSFGQNAAWNGVDGTRTISWDLTKFTSGGMSIADFITANNATEARIWLVTQGGDSNGNQGPMRFYFDNIFLTGPDGDIPVADFEPLNITPIIQLPTVPDTDSIGFNPQTHLLHRLSGAESYRNDPTRVGYRDNQFMETVDVFSPDLTQVGVFNANAEEYGLPAPRPTFVEPTERRTDEQTDPSYRVRGPNEYHALRDLTWSDSENVFYGTDETGIYRLTAAGTSTFVGMPAGLLGGAKGITFYTINGERKLLVGERDGPNIWQIDPATGQVMGEGPVLTLTDVDGNAIPGMLSLVEHPDGTKLLAIAKSVAEPDNAFARNLVSIDTTTGVTTPLGGLNVHMADLAFVFPAAQAAPRVTDVYVSGSTWTDAFKGFLQDNNLGDATFGFRVGEGQAALDELSWANANEISIRFDGPVNVKQADLAVRGKTLANYTISGFRYDNATKTATWTLAAPVASDRVELELESGDQGVTSPSGTPLDGEYVSTAADGLPSGDGTAGGDFNFDLNFLPADANRDGIVNATDLVLTRNRVGRGVTNPGTGTSGYSVFNDVNGDGTTNASDLVLVRNRVGQSLPGDSGIRLFGGLRLIAPSDRSGLFGELEKEMSDR